MELFPRALASAVVRARSPRVVVRLASRAVPSRGVQALPVQAPVPFIGPAAAVPAGCPWPHPTVGQGTGEPRPPRSVCCAGPLYPGASSPSRASFRCGVSGCTVRRARRGTWLALPLARVGRELLCCRKSTPHCTLHPASIVIPSRACIPQPNVFFFPGNGNANYLYFQSLAYLGIQAAMACGYVASAVRRRERTREGERRAQEAIVCAARRWLRLAKRRAAPGRQQAPF